MTLPVITDRRARALEFLCAAEGEEREGYHLLFRLIGRNERQLLSSSFFETELFLRRVANGERFNVLTVLEKLPKREEVAGKSTNDLSNDMLKFAAANGCNMLATLALHCGASLKIPGLAESAVRNHRDEIRDVGTLRGLLAIGVSSQSANPDNHNTPIYKAAAASDLESVKLLLKARDFDVRLLQDRHPTTNLRAVELTADQDIQLLFLKKMRAPKGVSLSNVIEVRYFAPDVSLSSSASSSSGNLLPDSVTDDNSAAASSSEEPKSSTKMPSASGLRKTETVRRGLSELR